MPTLTHDDSVYEYSRGYSRTWVPIYRNTLLHVIEVSEPIGAAKMNGIVLFGGGGSIALQWKDGVIDILY